MSDDTFTARSKFHFTSEDKQAAISRFCETYNDGSNKAQLIRECIAVGFMMKEAGLSDFLLNLDKEPQYHSASNLKKMHIMKNELAAVFGLASAPPAAPIETATEPESQREGRDELPESQPEAPQPSQPKRPIPSFGVGVKK
ncbi:TPA: hypothetical protein L3N15_004150 [Vibrio parahaemolyticus]|nr:hypothetical protein [Vibrio parahaemolyticus]